MASIPAQRASRSRFRKRKTKGDELSEEGMLPEELEEPPPEPTEAERTASPDEVDAIFAASRGHGVYR